jgi:hypothetical protein
MACGDDNAGCRVLQFCQQRDHRRADNAVCKLHLDASVCHHFGGFLRKFPPHEPRIIPDDNTVSDLLVVLVEPRGCKCHAFKILKCEVVADDCTPTVRAELDDHVVISCSSNRS